MALSRDERATLEAWLGELTREMQQLSRRIDALATVIRQDGQPPPDQPPPRAG